MKIYYLTLYLEDLENFEVSLVKYLCPICGKVAEEGIILNSLLTEKNAKEVKELNGKAIGYADHACKECAKYSKEAIFVIGIDKEKSDNEPYRTGDIVGIRKGCPLAKHIEPYTRTLEDESTYCFMDKEVGIEFGLWK